MNLQSFKAPYLPYDDIRREANRFLNLYASNNELPVEIEEIIDCGLKIDIIPIYSLRIGFEVEAFISSDFKSIRIDHEIYDRYFYRYRFSLAHEIGHFFLHQDVYKQFEFTSTEEWKSIIELIPPKEYSWLEKQAYDFAGLILVPDRSLKENFNKAVELVKEHGYSIDDFNNTELFFEYVCRYLKDKYQVSEQVINKRLSKNQIYL